jgi:hypothetical protein
MKQYIAIDTLTGYLEKGKVYFGHETATGVSIEGNVYPRSLFKRKIGRQRGNGEKRGYQVYGKYSNREKVREYARQLDNETR